MTTSQGVLATNLEATYPIERKEIGDRYLTFLGWVLLGYAIGARGFAYVGIHPLYIGEIALAFGLLALCYSRSLGQVFQFRPAQLLVLMMAWCLVRTAPYITEYGVDAVRDAMAIGYGVFAIIVAAVLIDKPDRFRLLFIRYRRFAILYLSIMWILFLLNRTGFMILPHFPGAPVEIISTAAGPIMLHVAGATAFILVGLVRSNPILYALVGLEFFVLAAVKRSGMLAFFSAVLVVLAFKHSEIKLGRLFGGMAAILVIAAIAAPFADIVTKTRTISVDQVWTNLLSITSNQEFEGTNVDNTIEWRLEWWGTIIDYTIGGEYFWIGKGFGVNLAEDDGFLKQRSVQLGSPTRSPHNGHLMILARAGVPGLLVWLLLQFSWASAILRACLESRRAGDFAWSGIFLFLLAYWAAFMTETSFNNLIETPYQGIWLWALFGVGIAALYIYRTQPEIAWD